VCGVGVTPKLVSYGVRLSLQKCREVSLFLVALRTVVSLDALPVARELGAAFYFPTHDAAVLFGGVGSNGKVILEEDAKIGSGAWQFTGNSDAGITTYGMATAGNGSDCHFFYGGSLTNGQGSGSLTDSVFRVDYTQDEFPLKISKLGSMEGIYGKRKLHRMVGPTADGYLFALAGIDLNDVETQSVSWWDTRLNNGMLGNSSLKLPAAPETSNNTGDSPYYIDSFAAEVDGVVYIMGGGDMQAVFARSTLLAFDTRFFSASGPVGPGQASQGGCSLPSPWEGKASNCWRQKAFMPTTRRAMVGVALPGSKKILVAGGFTYVYTTHQLYLDTVDVYDIATDSWSTLPQKLQTPRAHAMAYVSKGVLYLVGGVTSDGKVSTTTEAYTLPSTLL
jgi:hypothetical protein